MSTIDSLSFISAITFGRDIVWRLKQKPHDNRKIIPYIRIGLIFISIISLTLAYLIPSVVRLLFTLGSIIIPSLILPFIISLITKDFNVPEKMSIQWILIPLFISFFWLLLSNTQGLIFTEIEPFYPGMVSSFLYYFIIIRGYQWQLK